MPYKSPIELAESINPKWQPKEFKDSTLSYKTIPNSKVYSFSDGDYSGTARVYDTPSERNIYEGRVSPDLHLSYKGIPIAYENPQHKEFIDKLITYLDSYGIK